MHVLSLHEIMEAEESIKPRLIGCLSQQLSEMELLTSMYPNKEDIMLTDSKILTDMRDFIDDLSQFTPNHLDFTLKLYIGDLKLEVLINLPNFYPEEEPYIYVRCNQLNRQQETTLNSHLSSYIKDNHLGEQCLYTAILWVQENIETHYTKDEVPNNGTIAKQEKVQENFARLWIYSHHIYNKKKREEILKAAKEFSLTGFCLPGKPGIICIEGLDSDCKEWWRIIKGMSWKKIVIRKTEVFDVTFRKKEQKFEIFEELHFANQSSKRSTHSDMSEFSRYIEKFGLNHIFNEFFGLCNIDN